MSDRTRDPLFKHMPRGIPAVSPATSKPPTAEFANPRDIRQGDMLKFQMGKLFLGVLDASINRDDPRDPFAEHGQPIGIEDDRHVITVAGSRAGKGRSAILPNMLTYTGSILATDPKGELAELTAIRRAETLGQNVRVLDPFGVANDYFNRARRQLFLFYDSKKGPKPNTLIKP